MTYLIIGSSGFIGSHVVEKLASQTQSDIYCVDPHTRLIDQEKLNIRYTTTFDSLLPEILSHRRICVIYAAYVTSHLLPKTSLSAYARDIQNLAEVLQALSSHPCVSFRYISSSSVYAPSLHPISEAHPTHAHNPYSLMKLQSEELLQYYHSQTGHQIIVFRLFSCYGPRQNPQTIFGKLISSLMPDSEPITLTKNGSQVRDYLHIRDIVDALTNNRFPTGYNIYNLCGSERLSLKDLADLIGARVILQGSSDQSDFCCGSHKKLATDTDWSPRVDLTEGLASLSPN
jgi:nucleoside-diphosphate-sugar epimerase